jgi:lipopolysaccharide cholinephosphotransferase
MLYKLLKDVSTILNECNLEYFIDGGTMLGQVREGGLIPYDDDIDLGMTSHNFEQLHKITEKVHSLGYGTKEEDGIYKVYIPNQWVRGTARDENENVVSEFVIGTPTLDIFKYSPHGQYYVLHNRKLRLTYPKARHHKRDLRPLKEVSFGSLKVSLPRNPLPYLDGQYPNWKKERIPQLRSMENPQLKI